MNEALTKNTINNVAKTILFSVIFSCVFVIFINHVISIGLHELYIFNGKNTIHELIATLNIFEGNNPLKDLTLNTVALFYYHSIQLHSFIIDLSAVIVAMLIFDTLVALIKKRDIRPSKITLGLAGLIIYLYVTSSLITEPLSALALSFFLIFVSLTNYVIKEINKTTEKTIEAAIIYITSTTLMCICLTDMVKDIEENNMAAAWENTSPTKIDNELIKSAILKYEAIKELRLKNLNK